MVYLHAGVERRVCPTSRQQQLARDLAADGATVVAMSHAHVLQPFTTIGSTAVAYGLGNFVFAARSPGTSTTGVLDLEVPPTGAPRATWAPGAHPRRCAVAGDRRRRRSRRQGLGGSRRRLLRQLRAR